jgi:two-component system, cell cycle sensor histidine kinase and response regulator CckA
VLLDVAMPRLDGAGALREIRRIRRDARVILCSGYGELESQARVAGGEVEGFLQKPFTLAVLREQVRAALAG